PRTVFTVVQEVPLQTAAPSESPSPSPEEDQDAEDAEDETEPEVAAPLALVLVQEGARDHFQVAYAVTLTAGAGPPEVAASDTGSARLQPSVKVLTMAPEEIAAAYGDILVNGSESEFWNAFDMESDPLFPSIGPEAKAKIKKALPSVASISFANEPA